MDITYYGYNGFVLKYKSWKILVDPGASLYLPKLGPLIPENEWADATHIVVTHGDPDHYWHTDRVAKASGAPIICGEELVQERDGKTYMVSPREKKLMYATEVERVYPMAFGDKLEVDGVSIQAIPAVHGNLEISFLFGLVKKTWKKRPGEHFAVGSTGFVMKLDDVTVANLGDTMFLPEWGALQPDILMIPIGGKKTKNTMDEEAALKAVELIRPGLVIPCHYNCGLLFRKNGNPADALSFQREVKRLGYNCAVMEPGEKLQYSREKARVI